MMNGFLNQIKKVEQRYSGVVKALQKENASLSEPFENLKYIP